jgi:site-specific DNA recombinase
MTLLEENKEIQKRVALYIRCSTDKQAEEGYGLEVQEDRLKKYCQSQGYEVDESKIYIDDGLSGTLSISARPKLKQLFEDAKMKKFDIVIVYRLDRFFRSSSKLLSAIEELTNMKIDFKSATESFDTSTPNGKFVLQMLGSIAELERETIKERMSGGRERAAKEGKFVTGVPAFGYKVNKKKFLEIVPDEARIVRTFFDWLVHEKIPLREIVRRANEMKFPSPKHKKKKKISPTNYWWKRTINRILVNEVYTGEFYYRKFKRPFKYLEAQKEENQRPKEEWIALKVPAIISKEMFQASLQQLRKNQDDCKRNTKRAYLFSKLIYCGYSGKKLQSGYQTPRVNKTSLSIGRYYHTYVRESAYN